MAVTDEQESAGRDSGAVLDGFEPSDLDGHTIDELSDYLDSGREPRNPAIEDSPGCQIAIVALLRLRAASWAMIEAEAQRDPEREGDWVKAVMLNISREARAGRDIPISHPDPEVRLHVTEGSIRGLVRAAGDAVGGAIVGRCTLRGDVTVPGAPIEIDLTASASYGQDLRALAGRMRERIRGELATHTELNVVAVDIAIQDIHSDQPAREGR